MSAGPPAPAPSLGTPRLHLRRTDSTNERARELALAGAPHGTLVTASEQTAGRGRQGRTWSAPPGSSLLMSLLLRSPPRLLPLMAAIAVCDAVAAPAPAAGAQSGAGDAPGAPAAPGAAAKIKWPNDIVLADGGALRKLAGILVEGRPQEDWAVLGIGVNVAVRLDELSPELRQAAGDRAPASGLAAATLGLERSQVEPTLAALLDALRVRLAQPAETVLEAWRARDALRGRAVSWDGGRGRAEGIDGDGRLIVALDGGGHTALGAGEVHLQQLGP